MVKTPRSRTSRILRVLGWAVLAVILALYIGFPAAMAVAVVWPSRADVGDTPQGFAEVSVPVRDGIQLAGWYAAPRNGAVVIVTHGAGGSRDSMRQQAAMLVEHGYGVLALDLRGHGTSGGKTNRLGWEGTEDIAAAVEFLRQQDDVRRIGALGSSMGGEVVLGASADCQEIQAIVADGATRRSTEELLALPTERPLVRNFTARVMYGAVRLLTWTEPPEPLLGEMRRSGATSFMLIAAGDDELEVAFNRRFADEVGERATVWVVPGVTHTGGFSRYPEEYERRVVGFLDDALLHDANGAPVQ